MGALDGSVHEIPLLDEGEAERACNRVHELRSHWVQRHDELPFFTLGAASYLDATNGHTEAYREKARRFNPLLREHFGWLLDRLVRGFSAHVGRPAVFDERLALPGFHVFLAHPAFAANTASIHYDLQYQSIDWTEVGAVNADEQRSLTLAIRLPASGAGLRIWDIDAREMAALDPEAQREWRAAHRRPTRIRYRVGTLLVHSGHHLHQIAPLEDQRPDDQRVTLQAHALPAGDRWVLYW